MIYGALVAVKGIFQLAQIRPKQAKWFASDEPFSTRGEPFPNHQLPNGVNFAFGRSRAMSAGMDLAGHVCYRWEKGWCKMTTRCPDCAREISLDAPGCPWCGKPRPEVGWLKVKRRMPYWPVIVAILAISITLLAREKKEAVFNSADGSVAQVVDYLHENLSNPGSFEALEWGQVSKFNGGFAVRLRYRHKEYYGGLESKDEIFLLNNNGLVESVTSR